MATYCDAMHHMTRKINEASLCCYCFCYRQAVTKQTATKPSPLHAPLSPIQPF